MSVLETTCSPLLLNDTKSMPHAIREASVLQFPMQEQQYSNWCWAAVAASVAAYYGSEVAQCTIANSELGRTDCCLQPRNLKEVEFDVTNVLGSPLNRLRCFERCDRHTRARPEQVVEELANGRPLCARIVWLDGGGHFVVIVGYWSDAGGTGLILDDPFWGPSEYSHAGFSEHYQLPGGRWVDTYYTRDPQSCAD